MRPANISVNVQYFRSNNIDFSFKHNSSILLTPLAQSLIIWSVVATAARYVAKLCKVFINAVIYFPLNMDKLLRDEHSTSR